MRLTRNDWSRLSRLLKPQGVLGQLAVAKGFITEDQLGECLQKQRRTEPRLPLGAVLVGVGLVTSEQLEELLKEQKQLEQEDAGDPAPFPPSAVLRRIGRYLLVGELGAGGAGVVWKAWDPKLRRWVALKEPRCDRGVARERFLREARAAAKLRHPNLIEVFEVGDDEGAEYMVMDYIEGRPLDQVQLDPRTLSLLMAEVCDAVEYMHASGILHRDIKPQNILVDERGKPHLGDFGVAKALGNEPLTADGTLLGTPMYMAPEQAARNQESVGAWTDVYALGATLYHALAGRAPFEGETSLQGLFEKLMSEGPPALRRVNAQIPLELELIVQRAMAKAPQDRYGKVQELGEDLRRFARGEEISVQAPSLARRALKWVRRNRRLATLGAVAILGLASGAIVGGYAYLKQADLRQCQRDYEDARLSGDQYWSKTTGYARGGTLDRNRIVESAAEAIRWYETAARALPEEPYPWLMRGRCLALLGKAAEAEGAWTEALRRNPAYGAALFERGKYFLGAYAGTRLPRRTRVGRGSVKFGPADPEDDSNREWKRRGEEDLAAARKTKDLDKFTVTFLEGALAVGEGELEKAIAALTTYAAEYPWDADAWAFLGTAHYCAANFERAEECLARAADLQPSAARYRALGNARYLRGRFAEAIEAYDKALKFDEKSPGAWCNRGLARQASGDSVGAVEDLARAINIDPRFARAYKALGTALYEKGEFVRARQNLERAADLDERDPEAHYDLGSVLVRLNEIEGAVQEFQVALENDPEYVDALLGLGTARMMKGEWDHAAKSFERASRLDVRNPDVFYKLALAREAKGDRPNALKSLRQALDLAGPKWPDRRRAEALLSEWQKGNP